jgi:hypothetical protein
MAVSRFDSFGLFEVAVGEICAKAKVSVVAKRLEEMVLDK